MRYAAFTALGLLLALTAAQIAYSHMTPSQQWHFLCFMHLATDLDCKQLGWIRL